MNKRKKEWWRKVDEIAEKFGWSTHNHDDYWCFSTTSPEVQDCNIEISLAETFEDLARQVKEWGNSFDVSEETYVWLDHFGHGKNGAPYDMKDCYEDMEWFKNKAIELGNALVEAADEI